MFETPEDRARQEKWDNLPWWQRGWRAAVFYVTASAFILALVVLALAMASHQAGETGRGSAPALGTEKK